jgi:methyltransferase, FkbM family
LTDFLSDAFGAAGRVAMRFYARKLQRAGFSVTEARYTARYLQKFSFSVSTIFDVGVYEGTPELYKAFPKCDLVLIDPLPESLVLVEDVLNGRAHKYYQTALGDSEGEATLSMSGPSSSLMERIDGVQGEQSTRVRVTTLDAISAGHQGPFGLKIDTEGYEMEVLKGASKTLEQCEFVITEASMRRRFSGGYAFSELIGLMASHGFEAAEVISHPRHNRLSDVLFVRKDSRHLEPKAVKVSKPGDRL